MKKKQLLLFLLSVGVLLTLSACGNKAESTSVAESDVAQEETQIVDTSSSQAEAAADSEEVSESAEAAEPEAVEDPTPILEIGENVSIEDICEFQIDYIDITTDVIPPSPGRVYSHYEADDGKAYLDFCIAYKNTETSDVDGDSVMSGTLLYAEKYEYTGFSMIEEDSRSDFTYSNITRISPLSTEYVHYLFKVPEEVQSSAEKIELKMQIGGNEYRVIVREKTENTDADTTENESDSKKTSGEVALGEVVTTERAEFSIDYVNITADVVPPHPSRVYSHYEADAGKKYVDICFAYKNTSEKKVDADEVVSAKLKYAEKYDYTGFSMIEEDSRSDFTYSNITTISPLCTEYVHYLFSVPDEVADSNESIVISFSVDGNSYTYVVR